jgi:hypothetical protein
MTFRRMALRNDTSWRGIYNSHISWNRPFAESISAANLRKCCSGGQIGSFATTAASLLFVKHCTCGKRDEIVDPGTDGSDMRHGMIGHAERIRSGSCSPHPKRNTMSRMILTICTLAVAAGCCNPNWPNRVSLVVASIETLGPSLNSRDCCDCVPHRPWTDDYVDWWDYHITEHTAQKCALRAFGDYRRQASCRPSHHFKMGFVAAYEDLALNRKPSPPIVPPAMYWNAYYRSCAGQGCIDDWFAGYDAGLASGFNSSVSRFHEVYLRRGGCNLMGETANCSTSTPVTYPDGQSVPLDAAPQRADSPVPAVSPAPEPVPAATVPLRVLNPYGR